MIRFQYISDIHLECLKKIPKINKIADNICLLGDIGIPGTQIYIDFIRECSIKFKNVFVIYGNHEYFNTKKSILENGIETMIKRDRYSSYFPDNVFFLNNNYVYVDKKTNNVIKQLSENENNKNDYIKIIGSTLWSNIDNGVHIHIKDYKMIYISKNEKLTAEYTRQLFKQNKAFIIREICREDIVCILMTHHGTHHLCNGKYNGLLKHNKVNLNSAYTTYIEELYDLKNLEICLNGHTHSNVDERVNKNGNIIRLLSNCRGYPGENRDIVMYDSDAYFEI